MSPDPVSSPAPPALLFERFFLPGLAHASYLLGSEGEAVVIDPRRDVDVYLDAARKAGLRIVAILETHLHADFVSGHVDLARATGAPIGISNLAGARFPHRALREGDAVPFGRHELRVVETPGHTPEGLTFVLFERGGGAASAESGAHRPRLALTGDTLFVGDVGRPDPSGTAGKAESWAAELFDSLHRKLLGLPDDVQVFPAHGAGSACGRSISKDPSSTIGRERASNVALRIPDRERFVGAVTRECAPPPAYFARCAAVNRDGPSPLADRKPIAALSADDVKRAIDKGTLPLDVRDARSFGAGHLPGSLNVGLDGAFETWAALALEPPPRVVLVADDAEQAEKARTGLARVGIDHVAGWLEGGPAAWRAAGHPVETLAQSTVSELAENQAGPARLRVLDVRRPDEWRIGHVAGAIHAPLQELLAGTPLPPEMEGDRETAVICGGGYRSSLAASWMRRAGRTLPLRNTTGGMTAWHRAGLPETTEERAGA